MAIQYNDAAFRMGEDSPDMMGTQSTSTLLKNIRLIVNSEVSLGKNAEVLSSLDITLRFCST